MEEIRSSETSVNTISTWRQIPEDGILHSYRRENLKSYIERNDFIWSSQIIVPLGKGARTYFTGCIELANFKCSAFMYLALR
jgi:hypothetical protein